MKLKDPIKAEEQFNEMHSSLFECIPIFYSPECMHAIAAVAHFV